jgi:hypothetical protein
VATNLEIGLSRIRLVILAQVFEAGGEILLSVIHKLIKAIWNKAELPNRWKDFIIAPIHKEGNKTDCNNCHRISLLSA